MRPLRIAFITNEFITGLPNAGGLGNYLNRMSQTLHSAGHEVEIFTLTDGFPHTRDHHGVRVQSLRGGRILPKRFYRYLGMYIKRFRFTQLDNWRYGARALAHAFARRHRLRPFDLVQSTNCGLAGSALRIDPPAPHLMRMSSARDLWLNTDRKITDETRLAYERLCQAERECIDFVDLAYAPSQFIADYFEQQHGKHVHVLRPPACIEVKPSKDLPPDLPPRYLLHFGTLMRRKGTDVLAKALPIAWQSAPGLCVVMAGRTSSPSLIDRYRQLWGERARQVIWLGALKKPQLYAVLSRAMASVLPSLVDNLPNTAIESLLFNVPVIGSNGASIDELVEDGRSGKLVPIGDSEALADAMVRTWRREPNWLGAGFQRPAILDEMQPERAAENLIQLALASQTEPSDERRAA
ncbi:MAG: glycosyltransferase family 4 protein [Planctomycetales bacterium]|nr:glycosyltransferase family 4 protein [Planctomycetales bacterium]